MKNDSEIRRDAILNSIVEMARSQLETHFISITKAAEDSFMGDEAQSEPIAKATLSVEWSALAQAPKIAVKLGWSVRYKDEQEEEIDPLQSKLGLPEAEAKR